MQKKSFVAIAICAIIICAIIISYNIGFKSVKCEECESCKECQKCEVKKPTSLYSFSEGSIDFCAVSSCLFEITLEDGKVFLKNETSKNRLEIEEKIIYVETINDGHLDIYAILMISENNNLYEYNLQRYNSNNYSPILLQENIQNILVTAITNLENPGGAATIVLGLTTDGKYEPIGLESYNVIR